MKTFKLLDYTAQVFYNKDQHYPFCLHLYDNCSGKQLHVGYYISVESVLRALINKQIQLSISEQTTLESLVNSVETYVSLLHDNVVKVVKSLR